MESPVEEIWLRSFPSSATKQMCEPGPIMCPLWAWFPRLWHERLTLHHPMFLSASQALASSSTSDILHRRLLILNPYSHSPFWGSFQHLRKINLPLSLFHDTWLMIWEKYVGLRFTCIKPVISKEKHKSKNPILLTLPLIQTGLHAWSQKNLSASFSFYKTDITLIYSSNIYWIPPK